MTREPTHPGEILKEDVFPALKLKSANAAQLLKISRQYMSDILNTRKPLNTLLCLKIGKLVGNEPEMWMNLQSKYNLWKVAQDNSNQDILSQIPTLKEFEYHSSEIK